MSRRKRRHFSPEDKIKILRLHLLEGRPISELCEEHGIHPTLFYQWQKTFFENGASAFESKRRTPSADQALIARLQGKLRHKGRGAGGDCRGDGALKKRTWGRLTVKWVAHDIRDAVVDFMAYWSARTELPARRWLGWLEFSPRKFERWQERYGKANEHNGLVPRDHWLEEWEKEAIVAFFARYPLEGYRRLAFMMLDADVVAVSPSSVYRVLRAAGLIAGRFSKTSHKGKGFVQPLAPHDHWHVDFSYLNIGGTFYYLCSVLDGYSRYIVAWDVRTSMQEADAEIVLQRGREAWPGVRPRIISDRGSQFAARDFKEFIRLWQTSHVLTSPHYPQSNGKLERFHRTLKQAAIRPKTPLCLKDARRVVGQFIEHYNSVRLHSAIGYVTPRDRLEGRADAILRVRDEKLEQARALRARKRLEVVAR